MSVATLRDFARNEVLGRVAASERESLLRIASVEDLAGGSALHDEGKLLRRTWFPLGGALAGLSIVLGGDARVDSATIGAEGFVGGATPSPRYALHSARVVLAGRFVVIDTAELGASREALCGLLEATARYNDFLLSQVFRIQACNARHSILQRSCRRLLELSQRSDSNEVVVRQEDLAMLVGVGRSFLNRTVTRLKENGMIETRRGRIIIRNREGLTQASCGCAAEILNAYSLAYRPS